jgi:hypothetical protein
VFELYSLAEISQEAKLQMNTSSRRAQESVIVNSFPFPDQKELEIGYTPDVA